MALSNKAERFLERVALVHGHEIEAQCRSRFEDEPETLEVPNDTLSAILLKNRPKDFDRQQAVVAHHCNS